MFDTGIRMTTSTDANTSTGKDPSADTTSSAPSNSSSTSTSTSTSNSTTSSDNHRPSPKTDPTPGPILLSLPAELRARIYTFLFANLALLPIPTPSTPSHHKLPSTRPTAASALVRSTSRASDTDADTDTDTDTESTTGGVPNPQPQPQPGPGPGPVPANLSILRTSRKVHAEAYPVLVRTATFRVHTARQHVLLTQPRMLPLLDTIRHLSVAFSLLPEWSPTLLRLVTRSLSSFEIRDINVQVGHPEMVAVEAKLPVLQNGIVTPPSQPSRADLFQAAVAWMDEHDAELLVRHLGECMERDMFLLRFRIKCAHIGQIVVPGTFPMASARHEHAEREFTYAFGKRRLLGEGFV